MPQFIHLLRKILIRLAALAILAVLIRLAALAILALRRLGLVLRKPLFLVGSYLQVYEGNALYFALYASRIASIELYAVCLSADEAKKLKERGIRTVVRGSFRELWMLKVADAVFTVGYVHTDFSVPPARALRVLLWHNIPLKAMGKLNRPVADRFNPFDFIAATSTLTSRWMEEAFGSPQSRVLVTGQPKMDPLFETVDKPLILSRITRMNPAKIIAYLPTWRHDYSRESGGDYAKNAEALKSVLESLAVNSRFIELLERTNSLFVAKTHPWDAVKKVAGLSHPRILSLEPEAIETQELLQIADILVSDYSGSVVDWLLLSKPLVCYTYDYDEYWAKRGSPSFDYREVFGDVMACDENALIEQLRAYLSDPNCRRASLEDLTRKFHDHRDGLASSRIVTEMLRIL
jgi:CDP-glycerol glycerophosphotransferase (TagB/SpsB family)